MKTSLLLLLLAVTPLAAFAQGKVWTGNGPNQLVIFATNAASLPARYAHYAGQPAPYEQLQSFTVDLLAGSAPTNLTLRHSVAPAAYFEYVDGRLVGFDGRLAGYGLLLTNMLAGAAGYFQHRVWETAGGNYENAAVRGETSVFQASTGGIAPTPLRSSPYWVGPIILAAVQQSPAPVVPTMFASARVGNEIHFSFIAQSNRAYTVEYCDSLTDSKWITLTNVPAQSDGGPIQMSDTMAADERYFRVKTP